MPKEEKDAKTLLYDNLCNALDLIEKSVDGYCKENETRMVPNFVIKHYLNIIKDNYKEGLQS